MLFVFCILLVKGLESILKYIQVKESSEYSNIREFFDEYKNIEFNSKDYLSNVFHEIEILKSSLESLASLVV